MMLQFSGESSIHHDLRNAIEISCPLRECRMSALGIEYARGPELEGMLDRDANSQHRYACWGMTCVEQLVENEGAADFEHGRRDA